ncbi:uncharacterized protein LOC103723083 [Phoenix dactylifera]|uniref:Uncharacterized protein LOC103723083 n=1 Tax=Phoenix dactylifera TaxID=42345 RepID=A0A8B7D3A5_PHODC|nr:uncharacterized protein LOC103723083 [Phoenix dactylifera]
MGLMEGQQLESFMETIKSTVRWVKKAKNKNKKKTYVKMAKSPSMMAAIQSRKARKLIDETLQAADRPGKTSIPS